MTSPVLSKLEGPQVGRGVAACAVVAFHANGASPLFHGPFFSFLTFGQYGVDFFFVLSGFIIFWAHAADIGKPEMAAQYAIKRAVRLFPLLWLVVLPYDLASVLFGSHAVTGSSYLNSLLLYPSADKTWPQVVWTLRHEFLFYLAFCTLILSRRLGWIVFGLWLFGIVMQLALVTLGHPVMGTAAMIFSSFQIDFLIGVGVAIVFSVRKFRPSAVHIVMAAMALMLMFGITRFVNRVGPPDFTSLASTWVTLVLGFCSAIVLSSLLAFQRVGFPRFLSLLGDASYAIYLIHTPLNSLLQRIAVYFPRPLLAYGAGQVFLVCGGIAGGLLLHKIVEKPLLFRLRRMFLPAKQS